MVANWIQLILLGSQNRKFLVLFKIGKNKKNTIKCLGVNIIIIKIIVW